MRLVIMTLMLIASFGLLLISPAQAIAQGVIPPPGFTPAPDGDDTDRPLREPRLFSGNGDYSNPYGSPSSDGGAEPVRTYSAEPQRNPRRVFREPVVPTLVLDEGPPMPRVWFRAEALYWWTKSNPLPVPILTVGNPGDAIPGAIGQPGTSVLLGNQSIGLTGRVGGRYTFGFTFDADQTWGFEVSYFSLANASVTQTVSSGGGNGSALLAFPFFNPLTPGEDASPIALPGAFAGTAVLSMNTFLQATDLSILHNVLSSGGIRVDLLGGYRNVNLQEGMNFTTDSPNVAPDPPAFFHTFDSFNVNNRFNGAQVGVRASYDVARIFVNATGKLAVGDNFESISVNGGTFTNVNGGFTSANGAYLAQPTNMGYQSHHQFAVIPEMNMNLGVRLCPWASVLVGYSFLYMSSVARPGEQIDRVINPSQASAISNNFPANLSGPARPEMTLHNTDFWAQGLNLALELRF